MSSWFMPTVEASRTEWSLQTRGVKEDGKQTIRSQGMETIGEKNHNSEFSLL
jgi:hypothetical protein